MLAVGIYDYAAEDEDEVSLAAGEEVEVFPEASQTHAEDGWTKVRKRDGNEGIVPTDYLGKKE